MLIADESALNTRPRALWPLKIGTVLVLLLILALILPVSYSFYSTQFSGFAYQTGGSTTSIVVVMKESYILARIQVTINPQVGVHVKLQNGTIVTPSPSASVHFENGTTRIVTSPETFSLILPNTVTFSLERVGTSGPSFNVDSGNPIAGGVLTGNDTQTIGELRGISGIDTFYFQVTGYAQISVTALGVSI